MPAPRNKPPHRRPSHHASRSTIRPVPPPPNAQSPWVLLRSASRHPFIYQRMIDGADPAAKPGDVVQVYDKSGLLFGRGLYNPNSQIALRILAYGDAAIDESFWRNAVVRAIELRRQLNLDAVTDAYRLVHAEGDGLSGLIVERYADCLVFEYFSLGMHQRRDHLAAMIAEALGPPTRKDKPTGAGKSWNVIQRADDRVEKMEGFHVPPAASDASNRVVIQEHGVRYRVDMTGGHKTGFFCDQRDNRRRFANLCRDANVLDLCCYTGGFGLSAKILGGATDVTSVDLDEAALAIARENVNLNNARVSLVHSDAFIYLRQMIANGSTFDAVVLDPPKLAISREDVDDALRKYHDLNSLAMQVVRPGGLLLTCSCSGLISPQVFMQTVHRASRYARRTLQLFEESVAAPDHPILLDCPESAYLKAFWLRVL
jgi:23S rRNA (cytosine1962-C5)-methyltransferase